MNKRLAIIVAGFLLMSIPAFEPAWAASWVKLVCDPEVPSQTRENYQRAIDTVDVLFTKYKIVLSNPITIVLTTNDVEKYIQALMFYYNISRALAEKEAKFARGISSTKKPVIIIRMDPLKAINRARDKLSRKQSPRRFPRFAA